ncbi:MAG: DHH family phosphoesterase [Pirellulales bacterium]|nr:DHH family phosphoesterase [Pirellulales bacterium]
MSQVDWVRFCQVIRQHDRFLLTSHIRPDCDALGSELGMAGVLRAMGKTVKIINGHATPPNLRFIDPLHELQAIGVDVTLEQVLADDFQVLIVLDTSAWAQLGPMGDVLRQTTAKKIILDHHLSSDDLGAEEFKNTTAEATGRLVVEAAHHLGVALTPEMAAPLFAAVATDTGWFRFGSAGSGTYRTGAELIDAGAKPSAIYNALYEQDTLARVKLVGRILARAETLLEGRLIHTAALLEDFQATGALPQDTEDVINLTLQVGGTQVAIILVEQASGGFKISFRSRCHVECNKLAEKFNGGGHKAAAGAFIKEPFAVAQKMVLEAAVQAITNDELQITN